MAATIKQIGNAAGVSPATVSLVLNRKPGVGSETRDRVLAASVALGYRQRRPSLAPGPRTIRFLRIAKHGHIINPSHRVFIADYIDGIESEARRLDCAIEIASYEHFDPQGILRALEEADIGGAIVLGTELDEEDVLALRSSPVPLVFIDTYHAAVSFDFVDMDNESSVLSIVEYLHTEGHRRIGLVKGSIETRNFKARERCFNESLERFGLALDPRDLFAIDSTCERGREDMARLLKGRQDDLPSALFCINDVVAYGCIAALGEAGVSVPDAISIVGFDDLPSNVFMNPPLTSMKVSKHRIGQCAMAMMATRLEDPGRPSEKTIIGGELVVRSSVARLGPEEGSETS